jgi:hypothetical protein
MYKNIGIPKSETEFRFLTKDVFFQFFSVEIFWNSEIGSGIPNSAPPRNRYPKLEFPTNPSMKKIEEYKAAFMAGHPLPQDCWAMMDGLKLFLQQVGNMVIQERY